MDLCKEKIQTLALKEKIEIYEGKGPNFEGPVPKTIHQDRVQWVTS